MLGISEIYEANMSITAAAIIGGSFFGDKMSPLSDTTNIASLASDVSLYEHIHSMMYTTLPSAFITALLYALLSPAWMGSSYEGLADTQQIEMGLMALKSSFSFTPLLLLPVLVVIIGSIRKYSVVLTLMSSSLLAMILAYFLQRFDLQQIFQSAQTGFHIEMIQKEGSASFLSILNRGGIYNLKEGVFICLLVFAFLGTLQVINAVQISIQSIMHRLKRRSTTVLSTLIATLSINLLSSNQYATSFIIGTAFKEKYDELGIPRKVLSRSIEDAGTMMENLAPWTPSGLFMAAALGVNALQYAPYQFLSWINILVAMIFASTGIACFYNSTTHEK